MECQLIRTCDEGVIYYYINIYLSCYGLKYRSKYIRLIIIIVENIPIRTTCGWARPRRCRGRCVAGPDLDDAEDAEWAGPR